MSAEPEPLRVLLVEDDDDDAVLVTHVLRRAGFAPEFRRVDTAAALRDALRSRWDLVLSDFEMPAFDGLEAFAIVQEHDPELPFVFVSGTLGEERAVAAMRAGARDYLLKSQLHRLGVTVRRELRANAERAARREADARTAQHQRRMTMALEVSGLGIFEQRADESYLSDHWCSLLGDLAGVPFPAWFSDRLHPDDLLPFQTAHAAFVVGRHARLTGEYRLRRADGQWIFARLTLCTVEPEHHVGVLEDLTGPHLMEAELRQAQKMDAIGRLAGGVAHDFNNLLTAILGFGEIMGSDPTLSSALRADLGEILGAARKAEALTTQLLAFSRRRSIEPKVLAVADVIRDAQRLLTRLIGPRVVLEVVLPPPTAMIRIDPVGFEQVLINLVVNARDAMPAGGRLVICADEVELDADHPEVQGGRLRPGPHVRVAVVDSGTGIDPAILGHLFEPFFTTKEVGKGTGLGLSTCYGIVRQADGSIVVESELGVGSRFELHFPRVVGSAPARPDQAPQPEREAGTEMVLVVDDDPLVGRLVRRALSRVGFDVRHATDGAAALELEREIDGPIDLLLTDVLMPGMDGVELAAQFERRRPGVPVLFMTGYSEHAALRRDATVLDKPFTLEALLAHVNAALGRG